MEENKDRQEPELIRETIYAELQAWATRLLRARRSYDDPNTVSLVNGALVRFLKSERDGSLPEFNSDEELLLYLARALRNDLVSRARRRLSSNRPPADRQESLYESRVFPAGQRSPEEVMDLHNALQSLERLNPHYVRVVELIWFAGFTKEETGRILQLPGRRVRTDWDFARAWLKDRLRSLDGEG